MINGLAANIPGENNEDEFEEYEQVESIILSASEEETHTTGGNEEVPRCRFCWSSKATPDDPLF